MAKYRIQEVNYKIATRYYVERKRFFFWRKVRRCAFHSLESARTFIEELENPTEPKYHYLGDEK